MLECRKNPIFVNGAVNIKTKGSQKTDMFQKTISMGRDDIALWQLLVVLVVDILCNYCCFRLASNNSSQRNKVQFNWIALRRLRPGAAIRAAQPLCDAVRDS